MIESLALVAKELAKSIGEAVKEAAMSEISELPDKAGELTEVESLPDKVDLVSEDLGWGLVSDVEADDDDVPDNHSAENIDPRLKDLPHPNIPDKDWPPHAHKRVFDEMFKHIDAIKRTNGNQDVPVESKVLERNENGEATLWAFSFESEDSRYTYIMGSDEHSSFDKPSLWGIAEKCTNARSTLEDTYYDGWDKMLGIEYCVSKETGEAKYVVIYTYNEKENHDLGTTFAPQYGSKIDVSSIDSLINNSEISVAEDLCDDNGNQYRTEDGGWLPNNEHTLDGIEYKTDDNGSIYECDGKHYPDDWFVLNGNLYVTNADGEIIGGDIDENEQSNESSADQKETRELTDEERQQLKEQLGWTDKQLDKCTIDDDGVIHYRTDREDMEGKTAENGVRYERKTVDIHGVKVEGVFPVFDSAFDVQLPEELEQASNAKQFKECNEQLKEAVENNPDLKAQFTDDQLEDIANGDTPEGYVWHHNEETGKMQLVKVEDHDRTQGGAAHTGGKALWGGGYSTDTSTTAEGNKNNTSSEV